MVRARSLLVLVATVAVTLAGLAWGAAVPRAGAAPDPTDPSTSTTGTTSTTAPDTTGTTGTTGTTETTTPTSGADSTTTTAADDSGEHDVGSQFGPQPAFDPRAKLAVPALIAAAQKQKQVAGVAFLAAQEDLKRAQKGVTDYEDGLTGLSRAQRHQVSAAAAAHQVLVERAVAAFMQGGESAELTLLSSPTVAQYQYGRSLLGAVLDDTALAARHYADTRDALDSNARSALGRASELDQAVADATDRVDQAARVDAAAGWALTAYRDGSHAFVPGFLFPVDADVHFGDSFGDARLPGTSQAHWHEGCDVMAAAGGAEVAVEDGVVTQLSSPSQDPLGGLSVQLTGASGFRYYYAHLSVFAPGLAAGTIVKAGQLLGLVGSTGDASAPHLHFEIRDPKGQLLDAYGLLKAAWLARQQALGLPGTDPTAGASSSAAGPAVADPGLPGGFPRHPDGTPVDPDPARAR